MGDVAVHAVVTNGAVLLAFIAAYFIEVRPLARASAAGDQLAGVCMERAGANIKRFVWTYVALQIVLTAMYMLFLQHRGIDDGYLMFVFFPAFLTAYSTFLVYRRSYYSRLKDVIRETGVPVLVDLNRQILDKVFVWQIEVLSMIAIIVCGLLYFDGDISITVVSVLLLMWYFSIRTRKYLFSSGFSYWYKSLLFTNIAAQAIKLIEVTDEYRGASATLSGSAAPVMLGVIVSLIVLQLGLCLARLPTVWRSIRTVTRGA